MNILLFKQVYAHCPLCTAGAALAAGGAAYFGVSTIIIGLFLGAFAVSMGFWVSRLIKKKYIPFQRTLIILTSFATTIFPLMKVIEGFHPFFISLIGSYGSLLNRTYLVNDILIGSLLGSIIVIAAPFLSSTLTRFRNNKILPFQGVIITLSLLAVSSLIVELIL